MKKIGFPSKLLYKGLVKPGQMNKVDAIYSRKILIVFKKNAKFLVKMRWKSG